MMFASLLFALFLQEDWQSKSRIYTRIWGGLCATGWDATSTFTSKSTFLICKSSLLMHQAQVSCNGTKTIWCLSYNQTREVCGLSCVLCDSVWYRSFPWEQLISHVPASTHGNFPWEQLISHVLPPLMGPSLGSSWSHMCCLHSWDLPLGAADLTCAASTHGTFPWEQLISHVPASTHGSFPREQLISHVLPPLMGPSIGSSWSHMCRLHTHGSFPWEQLISHVPASTHSSTTMHTHTHTLTHTLFVVWQFTLGTAELYWSIKGASGLGGSSVTWFPPWTHSKERPTCLEIEEINTPHLPQLLPIYSASASWLGHPVSTRGKGQECNKRVMNWVHGCLSHR